MTKAYSSFLKSIVFIAMWIMSSLYTYSQQCLPNGFTISTQQQIDDFSAMYPNCTEIGGNLIINSSVFDAIYSLDGLSQIRSIYGNLHIVDNNQLLTLTGLDNLESVTGNLHIFENNSLEELHALSNLTSISGVLSVGKNDKLLSLFGIHNVGFGITDLRIFDNELLSDCGASNLCRYLSNGGNHTISTNAFGCNETSQILSTCLSESPCTTNRLRLNFSPILDGTYQAIQEVTSFGQVPSNGEVNFIAGMCISLTTGFEVQSGASFSVSIEDCGL
jgi:hypothetical protein